MNPLTNMRNLNKMNERELEAGHSGVTKKSWHYKYRDSAWVYMGGLPYDLTEGDIICIFSQWGEVVHLNLVRDHKTGKSKGFCFLCYEDQRSTILAVDNFNGMKVLGRMIRVDHVEEYKVPKEHDDMDDEQRKHLIEGVAPKPLIHDPRSSVQGASDVGEKASGIKSEEPSADQSEEHRVRKERKRAKKEKKKAKKEMKRAKKDRGPRTDNRKRKNLDGEDDADEPGTSNTQLLKPQKVFRNGYRPDAWREEAAAEAARVAAKYPHLLKEGGISLGGNLLVSKEELINQTRNWDDEKRGKAPPPRFTTETAKVNWRDEDAHVTRRYNK